MKNFIAIAFSVLSILCVSCSSSPTPAYEQYDGFFVTKSMETICASQVVSRLGEFVTIHQLSNGNEVWVYENKIVVTDSQSNKMSWAGCRNYAGTLVEQWHRAKEGQKVEIFKTCKEGKIVHIEPVRVPDYKKERVVAKVTKYDGNLSRVDGEFSAILLSGTSGSIHGEGMGSQNFFINIYFDEGEPISVNAKENRLWMDVEPGDIVIEKMINGLVYYSIKH